MFINLSQYQMLQIHFKMRLVIVLMCCTVANAVSLQGQGSRAAGIHHEFDGPHSAQRRDACLLAALAVDQSPNSCLQNASYAVLCAWEDQGTRRSKLPCLDCDQLEGSLWEI